MSQPTTDIVAADTTGDIEKQGIAAFNINEVHYTGPMETFDDRVALLNAVNDSSKLSEFMSKNAGESFDIENVAIQRVDLTNETTGETVAAPMVFLVGKDMKGNSLCLSSVSVGVYNSVTQIIAILGEPSSWPAPLRVRPKSLETPKGRVFTLVPLVS